MSLITSRARALLLCLATCSIAVGCRGFKFEYEAPGLFCNPECDEIVETVECASEGCITSQSTVAAPQPAPPAQAMPQQQVVTTPPAAQTMPHNPPPAPPASYQQQPILNTHGTSDQLNQPIPSPSAEILSMRYEEMRQENKQLIEQLALMKEQNKQGRAAQARIESLTREIQQTQRELNTWQNAIVQLKSAVLRQESNQMESIDGVTSQLSNLIDSHRRVLTTPPAVPAPKPAPVPVQTPMPPTPLPSVPMQGLQPPQEMLPPPPSERVPLDTRLAPPVRRTSFEEPQWHQPSALDRGAVGNSGGVVGRRYGNFISD